MKRLKKFFMVLLSILAISILATGCSRTSGYINHMTEVQLGQANFDIVKSVKGEANANYFLGIGGSQQDLFAQAKRDMVSKAGLKGSQALVNITADTKISWFLLWRQRNVCMSADVVQFK